MSQLVPHCLGNGDLAQQGCQHLNLPEEDQVVQRPGIRDGAHPSEADAVQVLHLAIELFDSDPVVHAAVL